MAGAKTKYDKKLCELAYKICLETGATDIQLSRILGVTKSTINNWKKKHPEFLDSLKSGKEEHDNKNVVKSLLKRALGYNYVETTREPVYTTTDGKKYLKSLKPVITKIVTKRVIESTTAQIFWLKNRLPEQWRDRPDGDGNNNDVNWSDIMESLGNEIQNNITKKDV